MSHELQMKDLYVMWTLGIVVGVGIGVVAALNFSNYDFTKSMSFSDNDFEELSNCENQSLEATARCLRNYVNTFYNYTVRDDIPQSLESLKKNGGDCYDYSRLYVELAKNLGFNGKTVRIDSPPKDEWAHAVAVISNSEGYCILDQLSFGCNELGN